MTLAEYTGSPPGQGAPNNHLSINNFPLPPVTCFSGLPVPKWKGASGALAYAGWRLARACRTEPSPELEAETSACRQQDVGAARSAKRRPLPRLVVELLCSFTRRS